MTSTLAPHEIAHDDAPGLDYSRRIITRDDLARLPAPEPLIGDTLDRGTVAVLAGSWGSGKSFLALDWAACVATGRPWQGREIHRTRVLYVAAEGASGLHSRITAWETAWGTTVHPDYLNVLPLAPNLSRASERLALIDAVKLNGYGLVVIDTLAKCAVGMDENAAKDMGVMVDVLYQIQRATPHGTVLVLHHAGKTGTIRGSSALEAGVDTVYLVRKDGPEVTVSRAKAKDRAQDDEHHLVLRPIDGTESAVISVHQGVDKPERADRLLSTFRALFGQTGATKTELRNASEMPNATFHRALTDLLQCGDLVNEGTDKRPLYKERAR
ncbi:AAA family ATPase [Dietzia sp. SLG510A3-30A2]|nr:AAA family ATPase [Dietzia sp. SLG510A3-30A2]